MEMVQLVESGTFGRWRRGGARRLGGGRGGVLGGAVHGRRRGHGGGRDVACW